ncbi:Alba [Musa troglodytarum]|uniref:Alba n=1 Tax=Musa troglodytarum TaxID=320322 RepID=A0A9E7FM36_9LILI|nr:Alba [Musa troglodytarum]
MDRYQRVEKPRPQSAAIGENEIRITTQGLIRNYVNYATSLLQESHMKEIVLKAMGQAISKTVAVTEFVKKRFPHLHQDTVISSVSITDVWEPIEEGLVPLEMTRHVSMISVTLSTRESNKKGPGQSINRSFSSHSNLNSSNNISTDGHLVNLMKIHMAEEVLEVEEEEEAGEEEDMVGMVDMAIIMVVMVDITTIKEDMVATTIKVDMVAMKTTKKMVDGTQIGVEVVDMVEEVGIPVVQDMVEEEVVEEMVAGVMETGEEGWVAVGEQTSFIYSVWLVVFLSMHR